MVLGLFLLVSTNHLLNTATTSNTVSFSGEGKVITKPDIATVSLAIVTEGVTSKAAQDANSQKSKSLTDFLKKSGVEDKDIKTSSYNINPTYTYPPSGTPRITGYSVNQSVGIKIRDLDKVNDILDGVVTAGVNQVSGLQFTVDDIEKLRAEARELAIKDAKKKADVLEDQIGVSLGKIVNFSENFSDYPTPIYFAKELSADGRGGMGGGGPSIPAGENEIIIQIQITYQIK
ncbi:MAG: SIMPL domain-containing protein [Patescibacteria group bacterium]